MKTITLQDKLRKAQNDLARAQAQREAGFKAIVRADARIKEAERTIARLQRRLEREPKPAVPVETLKPIKPENIPPVSLSADLEAGLEIPLALRRMPSNLADEVAKAELQTALNTQKQAKTRARIEKLKATKSGARQSMPLTGKAAADYIKSSKGV